MKILNRSFQALVFDFDGVLADSVEVKTEAFRTLFKGWGESVQDQVVAHHRRHGGMTRREKLVYYYRNFLGKELDDTALSELCDQFSSLVVAKVIAAPEISGALSVLERCRAESVPCFIDSATPDSELKEIVEQRGLSRYFQQILGSENSKTQNLERILQTTRLDPAQCLFFGDAASDYEAATACEVDFCGILPDASAPLLKKYPHIRWAVDFHQLLQGEIHG